MNSEEFEAKLKSANQTQIINAYDRADEETKRMLMEQVERIDFNQVADLYETTKHEVNFSNDVIEAIPYVDKEKLSKDEFNKFLEIGENEIKAGRYAVVTMAGGQGTRLGHTGPKGTFDIGLESHKSIFEILIDSLKEDSQKYGVVIPWYIMTSRENNGDTI